jgi:hypothetical protein
MLRKSIREFFTFHMADRHVTKLNFSLKTRLKLEKLQQSLLKLGLQFWITARQLSKLTL